MDLRLSTRVAAGRPEATPSVPMNVSTIARADDGAARAAPDG